MRGALESLNKPKSKAVVDDDSDGEDIGDGSDHSFQQKLLKVCNLD